MSLLASFCQTWIHLGRGSLCRGISLSDWPAVVSVGCFLKSLMDVSDGNPGQVVLDYTRKHKEQAMGSKHQNPCSVGPASAAA